RDPVLQKKSAQAAGKATEQHDQRDLCAMEMQLLGQPFDRERRVGFHLPVAFHIGPPPRGGKRGPAGQISHQAVIAPSTPLHGRASSSLTSAWGNSVRISEMEIAGRKRTNRNSSATKKPIVPTKTA